MYRKFESEKRNPEIIWNRDAPCYHFMGPCVRRPGKADRMTHDKTSGTQCNLEAPFSSPWREISTESLKLRAALSLVDTDKAENEGEKLASVLLRKINNCKSFDYPKTVSGKKRALENAQPLLADRIAFTALGTRLILEDWINLVPGDSDVRLAIWNGGSLYKQNKENLPPTQPFRRGNGTKEYVELRIELVNNDWPNGRRIKDYEKEFIESWKKGKEGLHVRLMGSVTEVTVEWKFLLDKDVSVSLWRNTDVPPQRNLMDVTRKMTGPRKLAFASRFIDETVGDFLQLTQIAELVQNAKCDFQTQTQGTTNVPLSYGGTSNFNNPDIVFFREAVDETFKQAILDVLKSFCHYGNSFTGDHLFLPLIATWKAKSPSAYNEHVLNTLGEKARRESHQDTVTVRKKEKEGFEAWLASMRRHQPEFLTYWATINTLAAKARGS
jgi:hypothetical protein